MKSSFEEIQRINSQLNKITQRLQELTVKSKVGMLKGTEFIVLGYEIEDFFDSLLDLNERESME
jgi:hypothetical protein